MLIELEKSRRVVRRLLLQIRKDIFGILKATPRKLVVHVLMHEIRHWAQIGTLFRMNGLKADFHDFLFSPVLGGEIKRSAS